jgi:hypothetical protein
MDMEHSERLYVYDRKDRNTTYSDIQIEIMFKQYMTNNRSYFQKEFTKPPDSRKMMGF